MLELLIITQLLLLCSDTEHHPGPTQLLIINHINVKSLCPSDRAKHINEIEHICCQESVNILCVSETWLNNQTPDEDIMITDY